MAREFHYYREAVIDYRSLERWLNLPEGFVIDGLEHSLSHHALIIRIKCPNNPKFRAGDCELIYRIQPEYHYDDAEGIVGCTWPDLTVPDPAPATGPEGG